jgi:hypothetical protein
MKNCFIYYCFVLFTIVYYTSNIIFYGTMNERAV